MVYLFYGTDSYRRQKSLNRYISSICDDRQYVNRIYLDNDTDLDQLYKMLVLRDLFAGSRKRVFVINGLTNIGKTDLKHFSNIIKIFEEDEILHIFFNENWPRKVVPVAVRVFFKNIKYTEYFFETLNELDSVNFLMEDAKLKGIKIKKNVVVSIYKITGFNMWMSANEIEKLSLLNPGVDIDSKSLDVLGFKNKDIKFYNHVNSILYNKDISGKMNAFETFIFESPQYYGLFGYLSKVNKSVRVMSLLTQSDIKIKLGFLEPEYALLEFILSI